MRCNNNLGDIDAAAGRQILAGGTQRERGKMDCDECNHLERFVLESLIDADRAETALRCCLLTHQWGAGVSDLAEYHALRAEQQATSDKRHKAYMDFVKHRRSH
jgi:hypothetical protein